MPRLVPWNFTLAATRVLRLCRCPVRSGYALLGQVRYFSRLCLRDKRRHSLKSNTDSPVRRSLTALDSGRAAERSAHEQCAVNSAFNFFSTQLALRADLLRVNLLKAEIQRTLGER